MKILINFKGVGMQGKSHIVNYLMNKIPQIKHLPQVTRDFLSKNKDPKVIEIYSAFKSKLDKFEITDGIYITERTPIDHLYFYSSRNYFHDDPKQLILDNGVNFEKDALDYEYAFLNKFDQVYTIVLENLDVEWMKSYFHSLPADSTHKQYYKGRGYFLIYQDNWMKAYDKYDHLIESDKIKKFRIKFFKFIRHNNRLANILLWQIRFYILRMKIKSMF